MKKRILINSISLLMMAFMSGCADTQTIDQTYEPAKAIVESPTLIRVPVARSNFRLMYGNDLSLQRAFNQYIKTGKAPNIITDGFVKFAYNAGQQPIIKTSPFQETIISLEPGEKFTNISSGDPNRWSYTVAVSGSGSNQQQIVLVKPSMSNISTNMVITTNRRVYNIRMISAMNTQLTRNVSFWYPDDMVNSLNNTALNQMNNPTIATVPDVSLNDLNFDYSIGCGCCHCPSWKPMNVFDDGRHTFIQFPASMTNRDMPVLFVLDSNEQELVNYRSKPPYFVVDKIFQKAVLIMGVGRNEKKITIINKHYS